MANGKMNEVNDPDNHTESSRPPSVQAPSVQAASVQTSGVQPPSVAQGASGSQPAERKTDKMDLSSSSVPTAHVVLYQPEIPQNTGNIGRTCVAVGAKLWIVRPAGFRIDDGRLKRAGLDYWQYLQLGDAKNWDDLMEQLAPRRFFFLSRFATKTLWDVELAQDDVFVFGRETAGVPSSILDPNDPRAIRLPTTDKVRSLNLATTAGIVLYEHQRQVALAATNRKSG